MFLKSFVAYPTWHGFSDAVGHRACTEVVRAAVAQDARAQRFAIGVCGVRILARETG